MTDWWFWAKALAMTDWWFWAKALGFVVFVWGYPVLMRRLERR
jgi:hypothetical protein